MNICEHLSATAKLFPDKEAIVFEGQRFTYAQLESQSAFAAELLHKAGVQRGDRVAILLPNIPAFAVWYYGALRLGAIAVSLSTRLVTAEVESLVSDCQAKVLIALPQALEELQAAFPDCVQESFATNEQGNKSQYGDFDSALKDEVVEMDPNDPALILYTSGTTGFAKGATLSHLNVRSNVHAFNHLCDMRSEDRILLAVPLFHCFGQNALLNSALNVGATLVLQRKFDLTEAKQLIAEEKVTQLYGVPMMFQLLHDHCDPADLSSVNYCFSAAATLPIQTSERWTQKFGMPIYEGYGLTETSPFACYNHRLRFTPGSIGTPIDCVEMKVVDTETGQRCPSGQLGELAIRGPNVMLGYWDRPEDTALAIREGWFHSGDIGRQDEDGFYYIVDRVKDMISVAGQKVYPAEVERVLLDHPQVSQAAVVGVADEVFGEKVVAYIVPIENSESVVASLNDKVLEHAKSYLGNYKLPRQLIVVDELPRNPSGKVLKTKLRDPSFVAALPPESHSKTESPPSVAESGMIGTRQPTLRKQLKAAFATEHSAIAVAFVQGLVQTISGADEAPRPEARFLDVGLDSLMIVEMSSQIQAEIGPDHEVPTTLVFDYPKISDLSGYLLKVLAEGVGSKPGEAFTESRISVPETKQLAPTNPQEIDVANMSEEDALKALLDELEA